MTASNRVGNGFYATAPSCCCCRDWACAPVMWLSFASATSIGKPALCKFQVKGDTKGAHLLRHTAATEMLRHGIPLDQIGLVLRHRSIDMSAYYAKVDVALLRSIAQTLCEFAANDRWMGSPNGTPALSLVLHTWTPWQKWNELVEGSTQ